MDPTVSRPFSQPATTPTINTGPHPILNRFLTENVGRSMPLQTLSSAVSSSRDLGSTAILDISCLSNKSRIPGVMHRFLVLQLRNPAPTKGNYWLSLHRYPNPNAPLITGMHSIAQDTATVATEKKDFYAPNVTHENTLAFQPPYVTLHHLKGVLDGIIRCLWEYKLWPQNCWLFTSLIQDILAQFEPSVWILGTLRSPRLAPDIRAQVRQYYLEFIIYSSFLHPPALRVGVHISLQVQRSIFSWCTIRRALAEKFRDNITEYIPSLSCDIEWILDDAGRKGEAMKQSGELAIMLMDMLQIVLDHSDTSKESTTLLRSSTLKLLQHLSWQNDDIPSTLKLQSVTNPVLRSFGGEAAVFEATLNLAEGNSVRVITRNVQPPIGNNWDSPEGRHILKLVRREVVSQRQLRHTNILPLLGVASTQLHPLAIVLPFAENGDALHYLEMSPLELRTLALVKICIGTASALAYIHSQIPQIIHGDVHGKNILVTKEGTPLLCDFGLSRIKHEVSRDDTHILFGGMVRHRAPELSCDPSHFRTTVASDCYAFAMTMLELATLDRPLSEVSLMSEAADRARQNQRPARPDNLGGLSAPNDERFWELIKSAWAHEPSARPSLTQVHADLELLGTYM